MDTDRNLLFGVLALQADLLDATRFAEACTSWSAHKETPLADLLVERGWLTAEERADVEKLLLRKLKKHGGDAKASLAEVTPETVRHSLAAIADPDVRQSLAGLTTPPLGHILVSTTAYEPGARDRYTLSRLHATGGIGRVWLARDASVGRDVALKELRPERAGNPAVWARFLKEAQVTGQLEHPGIVPVYEVGRRTEDKQPFYTMRFVRGRTLAEASAAYHRRRATGEAGPLELRELLTAFVGVCNAVAYAHSRGVLHRDLKPQNVILGDYGEVIVLDWGLAKLMDRPDDETAPLDLPTDGQAEWTMQGQVLGTPAYMAPEQAEGRLDLLGPASDVHGLGAILYEMLTGQPPFQGDDTTAVLRRVVHDAPPRPRTLAKGMPRALEAVCMKALAKKPAGRYATAKELAADVQRWLAGEPVTAYRDPLLTRAGRWAGRHRPLVSAAAVLLVAGVAGLSAGTVLLDRARADTERQRQEAVRARGKAEAVNRFLVDDLLKQADPNNNPVGDKLTVRELLDKAAGALETSQSLRDNPEVEGALRSAIGNTYWGLGSYQRAKDQLEKAIACQERESDTPVSERIFRKNRLCWAIYKLGSFDETMARQLLAQARAELGPDHEETVYAADTLATITLGNSNESEAFALLRENVAIQQRVLGHDHKLTFRAVLNLADALMSNYTGDDPRKLDEALSVMLSLRNAAARRPNHPESLDSEKALGFLYARRGDFAQAREVLAPLQERLERVMGPDHLNTAYWAENMALAEEGLGRLEAAEKLLLRSHTIRKNSLGDGHGLTRRAACYLGRVCLAQGKQDEAVAWFRKLMGAGVVRTGTGLAMPAEHRTPEPPGLADLGQLGEALSGKGDPGVRRQLLNELKMTVEWLTWQSDWLRRYVDVLRVEAELGDGQMEKDDAIESISGTISALERDQTITPECVDKARACLRRTYEARPAPRVKIVEKQRETIRKLAQQREAQEKEFGPDHRNTLFAGYYVTLAYWSAKQPDKAIPLAEDLLKRFIALDGRSSAMAWTCSYSLAVFYAESGRAAEAVPLLEEAYHQGQPYISWNGAGGSLVYAYAKAGKSAEAIKLIDELLTDGPRRSKLNQTELQYLLVFAGKSLLELREFARAEPIFRENLAMHEKIASAYRVLPWRLARARSFLGAALLGQKKYADAEPLLVAAYEVLRRDEQEIPLGRPEVMPEAIQRLVDLYEATGRKDKAEQYRKELEAAKAASKAAEKQ
jgi:tetratricopeptide (TPR) repeat protein/tRNA A-37 threonylcarbamoyl transferase component Bud32